MPNLTQAAEAILTEIETTGAWERDLLADLERTRLKRQDLRRALTSLMQTLPEDARPPLRDRMLKAAVAVASDLRSSPHITDKVEALHTYLRTANEIVTVREIHRHLTILGLAPYPDAASMLLARKAKQGVVERIARGRYRVNRDHPMLAG